MKVRVLYSVTGTAVTVHVPCWIAMDSDGEVNEYTIDLDNDTDLVPPLYDGEEWLPENRELSNILFTVKDDIIIDTAKDSLRFVDSFGVMRKPVTTYVVEPIRYPLEKDTWYWMGNPSEGDIFYPVYSLGTYIRIDEKVHQLSEVEGATFVKATMPGDS